MDSSALMTVLGYDADDLNANRAGTLSERQRERLRQTRRQNARIGCGAVALIVLTAAALIFLGVVNNSAILQLVGIGLTLLNAAFVGMAVRARFRLTSDIERGTVAAVRGAVEHTVRINGRAVTYLLKVAGERFAVKKEVFVAIPKDAPFTLYVTPESRALVGGEPLT